MFFEQKITKFVRPQPKFFKKNKYIPSKTLAQRGGASFQNTELVKNKCGRY